MEGKAGADRSRQADIYSLGTTFYALGNKDSAATQWEKAAELDPENRTAGMYLRMIRQMQALEEAEESGVHLEVERESTIPNPPEDTEGELKFTFEDDGSGNAPKE